MMSHSDDGTTADSSTALGPSGMHSGGMRFARSPGKFDAFFASAVALSSSGERFFG